MPRSTIISLHCTHPSSFLGRIRRVLAIRAWKTHNAGVQKDKKKEPKRYVDRWGKTLFPPLGMDYQLTIAYFESQGYARNPMRITKTTLDSGATFQVDVHQNTWATYAGKIDNDIAGRFGIIATDENGHEVDDNTEVEIQLYDRSTKDTISIKKTYAEVRLNKSRATFYIPYPKLMTKPALRKDISEYFKFDEGAILKYPQQQIWVVKSDKVVNVEYYGTWDFWNKADTGVTE
jgi:hypothetical protein